MYGGQVVEEGPVETIFAEPQHPYTQGLLKTILDLNTGQGKKLFCIDGSYVRRKAVRLPAGAQER